MHPILCCIILLGFLQRAVLGGGKAWLSVVFSVTTVHGSEIRRENHLGWC